MLFNINFESEVPIYTQLVNQIMIGMASGNLQEGDSLPSVRQLASDIGVNMHTINKAYNILKAKGFLVIHRRKGVVVSATDSIAATDENYNTLKEVLMPIVAEYKCRGLKEKDFSKLIEEILGTLQGE